MNSLANNDFKIITRFLLLLLVFVFSCDDIFVDDISVYTIQLTTPSSGWQGKDPKVSFRWEDVPNAVNYQLEVVTPGFLVNHNLVFEKLLDVTKFDTLLTTGEYEWRVKALNPASSTTYSTSSFVILDPLNIASKVIALKDPEDQFISRTSDVSFHWDAMEGANFYSFKIKKTNWAGDSVIVAKLYTTNYNFRLEDGTYTWGVAAIDNSNKKTDYSTRSITIDKNPPSVPILVKPANRDTLYSLTVGFNWRKTEPNATYLTEIYSDPGLKNKVVEKTLPDTATYINMEKSGTYYWNVKSTDLHGNSSNFSPASVFYILLPTDINQKVVKLMSPANESMVVDKKVIFWWNLLDGAEKYNLQIASPTFANPLKLVYDKWITGNSVTIELEAGNFEWRVNAANSTFTTGYSQSSFSIYNNDLTKQKTTLLKPLYAEQINKSSVNFSWEKLNGNANYRLNVKKDSWESGTIVQEMSTAKTEIELPFLNGEYFWGVKAIDPQNLTETEYSIRKFVVDVKGDLSGTIVSLVSPMDKSSINDKKVSFWWNPLTGSDKYNLQIATPSFTNPVKLIYDQWVTTNSVEIQLEPGNYEWRVKASNSIFETAFSKSSFSIYSNDLTNQKTTLLKPLSAELTNQSLVKFSWEKINSSANYHLLVKKDSWETGTIVQEMNTINTQIELPFSDGEYYWGIKAVDPINNSETEYSTRKFVVDLTAPEIPGLKSPENNLVIGDYLLNFTWEPSDATDVKLTYSLEIYQILNNSVTLLTSKTTQQKTIGYNFETAGKYKWRVNAKDNAGNQGAFSEYRYFEIRNTKDLSASIVSLKSPANGSTVVDKKVSFWWDTLTGAEKYNIEIATPTFANPLKLISDQWVTTNSLAIELEAGSYEWRVKAANSTSETGYSQSSFSIYKNDLTNQKITLLKPLSAELTNLSLVKFSWEKINSNANYHLIIKKDSWESGTIVHETNTDKTEMEFSFLDGEYFWGIKAIDPENNSETEYSTRKFVVDLTAPEIPALKSPENNLVTGDYLLNFTWEPSDATDIKLTYSLEIYQILNNSVAQLTSKTTQQKTIGYNFESAGKYKWRVNAKDNAGNQGAFSEYRYFEIRNTKDLSVSNVSLKSPANGSTVIDKNLTFWWDPLIGAEKYNIQIVNPTFANTLKLISDQWVTTNSLAIELEAGSYEWRVKATNSTSETSYSQSSLSVYNNDLTQQKITLIRPLYAETVNKSLLKLSWQLLNNNANYHLLIKKDSWESGTIVQEMNTTKAEIELSFLDGEYYWGIKAIDPQNNSETAYSTRKFVIDLIAPEIPRLNSPANNLITSDYLINFSWEPADAADTKLTYTLEMYKFIGSVASQIQSKTTQLKTVGYNFESTGKYQWRVYATDNAGNRSAYSEYRYFEIK